MNSEKFNALIKKLDNDTKLEETVVVSILPMYKLPEIPLFNIPEIPPLEPSILEEIETYSTNRSHKSELLSIMDEAIAELWENHDPKKPPTAELVKAWFKEKGYDRSNIEMEAIDKIMRPDRYKGGKNRM